MVVEEPVYRRFLDGDDEAFREIITEYKDSLIFFINRFVHNISVSEELAQDVFADILIHPGRYNFKFPLKTYIFTIGRNKAVDYVRKCERHPEYSYEFIENEADSELIEDEFIKGEKIKALYKALDGLSSDYSTVIHLVYFENLSYAEAGKIMRKNRKQITNLVYRAKFALKEKLGKESIFDEKQ